MDERGMEEEGKDRGEGWGIERKNVSLIVFFEIVIFMFKLIVIVIIL
jgi:hypothetical protein